MAFGLAWVLDHADTAEKQDAAAGALIFKTEVLWAQLDALEGPMSPPRGSRRGPGSRARAWR